MNIGQKIQHFVLIATYIYIYFLKLVILILHEYYESYKHETTLIYELVPRVTWSNIISKNNFKILRRFLTSLKISTCAHVLRCYVTLLYILVKLNAINGRLFHAYEAEQVDNTLWYPNLNKRKSECIGGKLIGRSDNPYRVRSRILVISIRRIRDAADLWVEERNKIGELGKLERTGRPET